MGIATVLPRPFVEKRLDETRMRVMVQRPSDGDTQIGWLINNASATGRTYPKWDEEEECYRVPKSHLACLIQHAVGEWGHITARIEFKASARCGGICKYADGFSCTCSCLGQDHGSQGEPGMGIYGGWEVIETEVTKHGTTIVTYRVTR